MKISGVKKTLLLLKMGRELRKKMGKDASFTKFLRRTLRLYSFYRKESIIKHGDLYVLSTFMPPYPGKAFERMVEANKATVEFVKGDAHLPIPVSTYISVTNRCMCHCYYCSNSLNRSGKELSGEEIKRIIEEIQDYGVPVIGFTGGEPLLRNDIVDIISHVDERSSTLLFTTGVGLDEKMAHELKNAGLFGVVISLDSHVEKEHNASKGCRVFSSAMDAIKNARKAGLYVALNTIPEEKMLHTGKIWEFLEFAASIGVEEVRILDPIPTGRLLGRNIWEDKNIEMLRDVHIKGNKIRRLPKISVLSYIEGEDVTGCGAGGIRHMYVDASGNLHPCDMVPLSFGNILEDGLERCMERMASVFRRPHERCIMRKYWREIEELVKNGEEGEKLREIMDMPEKMPALFEMMG